MVTYVLSIEDALEQPQLVLTLTTTALYMHSESQRVLFTLYIAVTYDWCVTFFVERILVRCRYHSESFLMTILHCHKNLDRLG